LITVEHTATSKTTKQYFLLSMSDRDKNILKKQWDQKVLNSDEYCSVPEEKKTWNALLI